jgi:hypothetical protein
MPKKKATKTEEPREATIEPIAEKKKDARSTRSTGLTVTEEDVERKGPEFIETLNRLTRAVQGGGFHVVQSHHFPSSLGRVYMVHVVEKEERDRILGL